MTDPTAIPTIINGRWTLRLPEHRHRWWTDHPRWEQERTAAMHDVVAAHTAVGRHPVVYDIGAEEGDLPALWASWGAHVALFEPDPRVWPNIRFTWEANRLTGPVACVAGVAGPVTRRPDDDHWADTTTSDGDWPACATGPVIDDHGFLNLCERPDVPAVRVDEVARSVGAPDIITIDVEGAELEVLAGAAAVLASTRPVVLVSVHPDFMRDMYGRTPADLYRFMDSFGYEAALLAVDHEEHFIYQHPDNRWCP